MDDSKKTVSSRHDRTNDDVTLQRLCQHFQGVHVVPEVSEYRLPLLIKKLSANDTYL